MGTSSSFKGPKNNSLLLPSWADNDPDYGSLPTPSSDPSSNGDEPSPNSPGFGETDSNSPDSNRPPSPSNGEAPGTPDIKKPPKTVKWSSAKSAMTRFAGSSNNAASLKKAGRSYVRARGGPQGSTRSARRGVNAVASLGGFLGDVVNRGFEEALRNAGIQDCIGRPAEEVFAKLADHLAPAGGPIDEGITRKAILDSLCFLYDKLTDDDGNLQQTESLGPDEVKEALFLATQHYIYQKWLNEVGIALEKKEISEAELVEAEQTIKEFVGESVRIAFKDVDVTTFSFKDSVVVQQVNSIFQETYSLIEQ